ncbi:MAG: transglycosylase SLT domain-containing protein [Bradymonadia bacterium]
MRFIASTLICVLSIGPWSAAEARKGVEVSALRLPKTIEFCGETIPVDIEDVEERLDRAFYLTLDDRAQVTLWVKRARRVFPTVERVAREVGACPDLKYLAVIESGLRPAVVSRAKAKGWWQFMPGSGRQYGLKIDPLWDDRADLERSTKAGLEYLVALKKKFGSWTMAMAAFNTGPGRLSKAVKAQGQKDYWRLVLLREAERYVPKIIVTKIIFERLKAYGFGVDVKDGYPEEPVGYVKVKAREDGQINLLEAARGSGISYRTLKRLNRRLSTDDVPGERPVVIRVPQGEERAFRAWARRTLGLPAVKDEYVPKKTRRATRTAKSGKKKPNKTKSSQKRLAKTQPEASKARRRQSSTGPIKKVSTHKVKAGESLWGIAKRYDVSIETLRRWNRLKNTDILTPGQRLVVRR